ncbi:MAG: hypothetical protein IJN81_10255, partial [Clostridia bacterium]|nr:hypothetical protein [Clostridia bacterium]
EIEDFEDVFSNDEEEEDEEDLINSLFGEEFEEDEGKGFSFAEELADGEDFQDMPVEESVVETATNVSKSGTVYEVVDDIDDEDDDEESFFRGFFKKK